NRRSETAFKASVSMQLAARILIAAIVISCGLGLAAASLARAGEVPVSVTPPAIRATDSRVPADPIAEVRAGFTPANRRYARVRQALALVDPLWDIAAALLLLATGLAARLRTF